MYSDRRKQAFQYIIDREETRFYLDDTETNRQHISLFISCDGYRKFVMAKVVRCRCLANLSRLQCAGG